MAKLQSIPENNLPRPRNLVEPDSETKQAIEAVAAHVARYGANAEFQLRAGHEGHQKFPFLYLDNQYAPYYQVRLIEARARLAASAARTPGFAIDTVAQLESNGLAHAASRASIATTMIETQNGSDAMIQLSNALRSTDMTAANNRPSIIQHQNQREMSQVQDRTNSLSPQSVHDQANSTRYDTLQHATTSDTAPNNNVSSQPLNNSTMTPSAMPAHRETVPYGLLQEVHLLDNTGTELSGLATYLVVSNTHPDQQSANPLLQHINNSPEPVIDAEPIYRLRPDTSVIFRAPHSRLLPVGFALGAEVKQRDNPFASIVVKRIVRERVRFYDVKDERNAVHENVPEDMLEPHQGGVFDFRLPH